MGFGWTDCDKTLRSWVTETCARLQAELGEKHVGTYLHGSLAAGSFHPPKSDVDILFVVDGPVDPGTRRQFSISAALANGQRPITGSLECSVLRRAALAERRHPMPFEIHFGEEWTDDILNDRIDFEVDRTDPDLAAHVQATWEFGVVLAGPDVAELFQPLPREDFLDSLDGDLAWILDGENILESPFYSILNVSRILWVLEDVSPPLVPSKEEAGEWLLDAAPPRQREVIRLALDVYRDPAPVSPAERPTGGRSWPPESLLAFRDWARRRATGSTTTSPASVDSLRIAVSGSHQVGKSTLVAALGKALPNHEVVDEPYYEMEANGHLFSHPPTVDDFHAQLDYSIVRLEEARGPVIFDRCPGDLLAYLLEEAPREAHDVGEQVGEALRSLDLIVFVPIERPDRMPPSRGNDEDGLRERVNERLRDLLMSDSLGYGIQALAVRGSVEERVAMVLARLDR